MKTVMLPKEAVNLRKRLLSAPRPPRNAAQQRRRDLLDVNKGTKGKRVKTTDIPEKQIGLGPVKRTAPAPTAPQRVSEGILRGPDGKLYTDIPPVQPNAADWFRGLVPTASTK